MERLTKWLNDKKALCYEVCEKECVNGYYECHKCKPFADAMKKLAEYEDLEEQGRLLRLKLKPNDVVYFIFDKEIHEGVAVKVISVRSKNHDYTRVEIVFEIEDPWYHDGRKMKHGASEIFGETVFLTKEEAAAALEKMKGEEHETY